MGEIYIPEEIENKVIKFYNDKIQLKYFNRYILQVQKQKQIKAIRNKNITKRNIELMKRY